MPVNFIPTGTDYFRILPEIIMTIGGTLIMLIEGLLGENKKTKSFGTHLRGFRSLLW